MPTVEDVTEKVQRILRQNFKTSLGRDDAFYVELGSTECRISCMQWMPAKDSDRELTGDHHVLVLLRAPVLFQVPITDELCRWIAHEGTHFYIGHPVLFSSEDGKNGELFLDHSLLGDFLDADELTLAVRSVLSRADRCDDELQGRFGGRRLVDR